MTESLEVGDLAGRVAVDQELRLSPLLPFRIGRGVGDPRLSCGGQVTTEHPGDTGLARDGERRLALLGALEERREVAGERRADGEHVFPTVLAVRGRNRDGRRVRAEREAGGGEAPDLVGPKAGLNGDAVEHRSLEPGHVGAGLALGRGAEEPEHLFGRERPPVVAPVGLHVEGVDVGDGRGRGSPVLHHPPAERLEGAEVVVEGLWAELLLALAESVQEGLNLGARDLRPEREAAPVENPRDAGAGALDVLGCVALRFEGLAEVGHVLRERLGHRRPLGVDQADLQETTANRLRQVREPFLERRVRLPGGGDVVRHKPVQVLAQLLAGGLAGESGQTPRGIPLVPELDVPLRGGGQRARPVSVLRFEESHEGSLRVCLPAAAVGLPLVAGWTAIADPFFDRPAVPSHRSIESNWAGQFARRVQSPHRGAAYAEKGGEFESGERSS